MKNGDKTRNKLNIEKKRKNIERRRKNIERRRKKRQNQRLEIFITSGDTCNCDCSETDLVILIDLVQSLNRCFVCSRRNRLSF